MNLYSCIKQHDGQLSPFAMLRAWEGTRLVGAEPG
jgi:hypothetical protein